MSNFLGQFSHSLGATLGNSLGSSIGHTLNAAAPPEELRIGSNYVVVREKVAEGGFGVIELVVDTHTQQKEMILKRCNVDRPEVFEIVKKEVNILQKFKGPYIVSLIDNDVAMRNSSREAYILLEYCPGGHLLHRLNERHGQPLPAESIYRIFGQILLGMKSLHEHRPPIIHRDIKLENILFGNDGKVRLCDFGSCLESPILLRNVEERNRAEESIAKETTQMYRSPEMVDLYMRPQLTEKADIWALGCVFFALAYLKHPFQDMGSLAILAAKYTISPQGVISEDAVTVLRRMLDIDPEARPSILELLLAIREVARGAPLPPYELSAEATQRRAERLAADEVRQAKAKKKPVANPIDVKRSAPPSANSVAAKRLAVKRGGAAAVTTTPAASSSHDDDLFASSSSASSAIPSSADQFGVEDAGFDPFGDSSAEQNNDFSAADDWSDVHVTPTPNNSVANSHKAVPPSSTVVRKPSFSADDHDVFAPSVSNGGGGGHGGSAGTNEFDPFADPTPSAVTSTHSAVATNNTFDPFAEPATHDDEFAPSKPTGSAAAALFGAVHEDDVPPPVPPTTAVKPSRPSFTATTPAAVDHSGFDMFDSHQPTPAAAAATSSTAATLFATDGDDFFAPSVPATAAPASASRSASIRRPSGSEAADAHHLFDAFAPTTVTSSASAAAGGGSSSARNSFTASVSVPATPVASAAVSSQSHHRSHSSTDSSSAQHLQDLLFATADPAPSTSSVPSSSRNSSVTAPSAFDLLPTATLEPVRAPVTATTHDLLDVPTTSSMGFSASTSSGKGSGVDVLSLYDMPKPEAPLQPMRSGPAYGTGLGGLGGDILPPPQALGYVPHSAVSLGGGRPLPSHPPAHPHNMMGRPMANPTPMMGSYGGSHGHPSISNTNPTMAAGNNNRPIGYTAGGAGSVPSYRQKPADPFDTLNLLKK